MLRLGPVLCVSICALAPPAFAEDSALTPTADAPTLRWDPKWRRFQEEDAVFTFALGLSLAGAHLGTRPDVVGERGGVLFDDAIRGALRSQSEDGRRRARDWSNLGQNAVVTVPFLLDTLALALIKHGNTDVALQTAAINTQAFLLSGAINVLTKNLASRERPYVAACSGGSCGGKGRNKSFISGHAVATFTAAGLVCAHHEYLELFENAWLDGGTCALTMAAATATSLLRISSDEHYATDVLAGAVAGLFAGYLVPKLIYYAGFDDEEEPAEEY